MVRRAPISALLLTAAVTGFAVPSRAAAPVDPALIIAVLLFVGLYLWGFVLGVIELAERRSSKRAVSERTISERELSERTLSEPKSPE